MMAMDRNYKIGKSLILDGTIKSLTDLWEYVPKTNIARDLHMHFNTLQSRIDEPGTFEINLLTDIADLMDVDPMVIIKMAYTQHSQERKAKKKK
jgi:hypothetical protein